MMGQVVWLRRQNKAWEGPFLVVDVGQRNHAYHQAVNVKTVVEVDFETAVEWGIVSINPKIKPSKTDNQKRNGYYINYWAEPNVEMWAGLEAPTVEQEASNSPVVYRDWYIESAEFCDGEKNRRWKLEDWMIKDYEDYKQEIARLHPPEEFQASAPVSRTLSVSEFGKAVLLQKMYEHFLMSTRRTASASVRPEIIIRVEEVPPELEILTTHTLGENETWTHLSLKYYGHTTEPYWRLIYEANQEMVGDNYRRIWGGMEMVIPVLPPELAP